MMTFLMIVLGIFFYIAFCAFVYNTARILFLDYFKDLKSKKPKIIIIDFLTWLLNWDEGYGEPLEDTKCARCAGIVLWFFPIPIIIIIDILMFFNKKYIKFLKSIKDKIEIKVKD